MVPENLEKIPIHFILSTGRTGSTLLSTMLNAHTEVLSVSEQPFTLNLVDGYANIKTWNQKTIDKFTNDFMLFATEKLSTQFSSSNTLHKLLLEYKNKLDFQTAVRLSFLSFFPLKDKSKIKTFVEKELIFHTQIKKITKIYPDAKFILLTRDPRDNVQIKINRAKRRNEKFNVYRFVAAWKIVYQTLFYNLHKHAKDKFIVVRYEDIVLNTETTIKNICKFLRIEYNAEMMQYYEKNRNEFEQRKKKIPENLVNQLLRDHQGLLKKISTDKVEIWKKEMSKELSDKIWNECKNLSEIFGYKQNENNINRDSKLGLGFNLFQIWFYCYNVIRPKIYFYVPFWIRRNYKKLKVKNADILN